MKIGELAARTGLTLSRIRYYEGIGLLSAVDRLPNDYRTYGAEAVAALNLIVMAQKIGFTLDEIRQLAPQNDGRWNHDLIDQTFARKIKEIEAEEARLAAAKARLTATRASIAARPEGIDCGANKARILSVIDPT